MAVTRRLIEEWLPVEALGEETARERRSLQALPAPYYLHVWWSRKPLVASRAAMMASLLPADADRGKFMHALGIHGDPVAAKEAMEAAKRNGVRVKNPYSYPRAFSYTPTEEEKSWLAKETKKLGIESAAVLDPTAGGGSIPFEALRLGLNAFANDLNPVASFVEKMTFEAPLTCGVEALQEYRRLSKELRARLEERLKDLFPQKEAPDVLDTTYIFARTMRCPHCGGVIPLFPHCRLAPDGTGVRLVLDEESKTCSFEIVHSAKEQSAGTVSGGRAVCPYLECGRVISGDDVKRFAQKEGFGEQLYAVVYKKAVRSFTKTGKERVKWERGFRAPRPEDDVMDAVRAKLAEKLPEWEAGDIVPSERFDDILVEDTRNNMCSEKGVYYWRDLFSPRQLYCHGTSVEIFRELLDEEQAKGGLSEARKAAFGYLAIAIDKLLTYNCRSSRWEPNKGAVAQIFERHDFSVKYSYSEMAPLIVGLGYDWVFEQTGKCLAELIPLLRPDVTKDSLKKGKGKDTSLLNLVPEASSPVAFTPPQFTISCQSGDCLWHIFDRSIDAVVMDPPYYDNVAYAELSDFFYVWLKRTAGYVYPEFFTLASTDKENEAIANPAMFKGQKKSKELAGKRYQERMAAIFAECRRVLKEDGVLLLMFTHKATGAWDALTQSLFDANFSVSASWPINTETDSLNIRDKAAAKSTIFLACRPRPEKAPTDEILFWEDLEPLVKKVVIESARKNREVGIHGIDLYLSCFGPALEEFSKHWPVKRGTAISGREDPYEATPGDVLQTARAAVKDWRVREILKSRPNPSLDPLLAWYVLAWDTFKAPTFPYDEALNLARVTGLDLDKEVVGVVAEKKASDIVLWDSATRGENTTIGPIDGSKSMLDALHRIANTTRAKSMDDAIELMRQSHLDSSPEFKDALSAVLEVLPISRKFSGQDVAKAAEPAAADFEIFEVLRIVAFKELERPRQLSLLGLLEQK